MVQPAMPDKHMHSRTEWFLESGPGFIQVRSSDFMRMSRKLTRAQTRLRLWHKFFGRLVITVEDRGGVRRMTAKQLIDEKMAEEEILSCPT